MSKLGDFFNSLADDGEAFVDIVGEKMIDELAGMAAEEAIKAAGEMLTGTPADVDHQAYRKPSCGLSIPGLVENIAWGYGSTNGAPNPFSLAVPTDHFTESETLAVLQPGQYYGYKFQVLRVGEGGDYAHGIQILIVDGENSESGWVLKFAPGRDEIVNASLRLDNEFQDEEFGVAEYVPGQPNTLTLIYDPDPNTITLTLNTHMLNYKIVLGALTPRMIKMRVVGMEVYFWGN